MWKGKLPVRNASFKKDKYIVRMYACMFRCDYWVFLLISPEFLLLFGSRPWAYHPPLYHAALSGDGFQIEHLAGTRPPSPSSGPMTSTLHFPAPGLWITLPSWPEFIRPGKSIWPMLADQTLPETETENQHTALQLKLSHIHGGP